MHINYDDSEPDKEDEVLHCINLAYTVFIDDMQIESDFIFYLYPHKFINVQTFFMIIPLNNIAEGKHVLKIINNVKEDAELQIGAGEGKIVRTEINSSESIPFYIQRN